MNSISMLLIWVAIGAVVGWGASMLISTSERQGVVLDTAFGALGGVSGGFLLAHFFTQRLGEQTLGASVAAASVGAAAMVVVLRLILLRRAVR